MKTIVIAVLFVTTIIATVVASSFYVENRKIRTTAVVATPVPQTVTAMSVPSDAVKISECIPYEGEHYVRPSTLPYGPIYVTYEGKVTALEFMFTADKIPNEAGAKMSAKDAEAYIKKNHLTLADLVMVHNFEFDLMGAAYKSITLTWAAPHSGLAEPHLDLHAWLVAPDKAKLICPDSKLENVYSAEVMENIQKYKIPFPSAPSK